MLHTIGCFDLSLGPKSLTWNGSVVFGVYHSDPVPEGPRDSSALERIGAADLPIINIKGLLS